MSRQRFIHPQIWRSPEFVGLPPTARLMFIGCITTADDHGRRRAEPELLKADIFPLNPEIGKTPLIKLRGLLEKAGLVRIYGDGRYMDIPNWSKYQNPKYQKPSKIPEFLAPIPADLSPTRPGTRTMGSGLGSGLGKEKESTPATPAPAPSSMALEFVTEWNALHGKHPRIARCRDVKGQRGRMLVDRMADDGWRGDWREALKKAEGCPFLLGENDRGWRMNVDWFLKPGSVRGILEGKYDGNGTGAPGRRADSGRSFAAAAEQAGKFAGK